MYRTIWYKKILFAFVSYLSLQFPICTGQNYKVPPLNSSSRSYKFGIQQAYTADLALNTVLYNNTFGPYLSEALDESFEVLPLVSDSDIQQAVSNNSVDFVYLGPTSYSCINLQFGYTAVASFINLVHNTPSQVLAGAIVTNANHTDINVIKDLVGKRIGCAALTQLTACQSQWIELKMNDLNLFQIASQVLFGNNSQQIVRGILTNLVDVGFVSPGQVEGYCAGDISCMSQFKFINPQNDPRIPGTFSTSLYPASGVAVSPLVDLGIRGRVLAALLNIKPSDEPARDGRYYGWTSPYSYAYIAKEQQSVGFIQDGVCRQATSLYDVVDCPSGYSRLNSQQSVTNCIKKGLPCPPSFDCVCYPCVLNRNEFRVGALDLIGFIGVVIAICFVLLLLCIFVGLKTIFHVPNIPFHAITLDTENEIGKSGLGRVLRGRYDGSDVIVKRAFPKNGFRKSVFDATEELSERQPTRYKKILSSSWALS